ncbi:acetyl-CoA carboxylase [Roseibium sediminis]|uniref:acetyl-CoA carboxylase n=1 Tax=Roseibium sediminis TaxID=1775174 RepID=UPI00123DE62C|nr:acetyl-CoA carboxylase [Roseibium sediminis]
MSQVLSPLPGTFYKKPSPDAAPYKSKGDQVAVGDTIGLVEVMKTFIEVKSDASGTFREYLADDSCPVMAGQPIAGLE